MAVDPMTPGAFGWCELLTPDVAAAKRFYSSLFGWALEDVAVAGQTYTVVKVAGAAAGGLMALPTQPPGVPPHWGVYVTVTDADDTARRAASLGGRVLVPPTDIPGIGRFLVVQDPQGAVISAIAYAALA